MLDRRLPDVEKEIKISAKAADFGMMSEGNCERVGGDEDVIPAMVNNHLAP